MSFSIFCRFFPLLTMPDASLHSALPPMLPWRLIVFSMFWLLSQMPPCNSGCGSAMQPPWRLIVFSNFWLLFPSLIMLDASLHFQIWWRNAANAASLEVDCLFKFLAAFSLSKNAGCLPALPVVAVQRRQHRLLGS